MSEPFVFDPRCDACKQPFGAVPCGQSIKLHCRPLASEGFTHCALVWFQEFEGRREERELLCTHLASADVSWYGGTEAFGAILDRLAGESGTSGELAELIQTEWKSLQ